jgi:hypothetical protein
LSDSTLEIISDFGRIRQLVIGVGQIYSEEKLREQENQFVQVSDRREELCMIRVGFAIVRTEGAAETLIMFVC